MEWLQQILVDDRVCYELPQNAFVIYGCAAWSMAIVQLISCAEKLLIPLY